MSYVYTVVIQLGDFHEENDKALQNLNIWIKENYNLGDKFEYVDPNKSAGNKCPELRIVWGGFNYLDTHSFMEYFNKLNLNNSLLTIASPERGFVILPSKTLLDVLKPIQDGTNVIVSQYLE